jgi:hypothetical protein
MGPAGGLVGGSKVLSFGYQPVLQRGGFIGGQYVLPLGGPTGSWLENPAARLGRRRKCATKTGVEKALATRAAATIPATVENGAEFKASKNPSGHPARSGA